MKHKLMSIPRTNLLYLPIVALNEDDNLAGKTRNSVVTQAEDMYWITVDEETEKKMFTGAESGTTYTDQLGHINGFNPGTEGVSSIIMDQGLNTTAISFKFSLDPDLIETRYIVEMDNRFGSITDSAGNIQTPNFIDDDHIASYTFTFGSHPNSVVEIPKDLLNESAISGPRGTRLKFSVAASIELNSSTYLFTKLGEQRAWTSPTIASANLYTIDTIIKVTGASTGRGVDIPVRFVKYVA